MSEDRDRQWEVLKAQRWGPAAAAPESGISVDRPDRDRLRQALEAADPADAYAREERWALQAVWVTDQKFEEDTRRILLAFEVALATVPLEEFDPFVCLRCLTPRDAAGRCQCTPPGTPCPRCQTVTDGRGHCPRCHPRG